MKNYFLLLFIILINISNTKAQNWVALAHGGNLYVGGAFTSEGNYISKWDGINWSGLGVGTSLDVINIEHYGDSILVGGVFREAGNITVNQIAAWIPTTINNLTHENNEAFSINPNPLHTGECLKIQTQNISSKIEKFCLYNLKGEMIFNSVVQNDNEVFPDKDIPGGEYLYTLNFGNTTIQTGKISIK